MQGKTSKSLALARTKDIRLMFIPTIFINRISETHREGLRVMKRIAVTVCVLVALGGCARKEEGGAAAVPAPPQSAVAETPAETTAPVAIAEQPTFEDPKYPLLIKGIGLGHVKPPCVPKESLDFSFSDENLDPSGRFLPKCSIDDAEERANTIEVTFSLDGTKIIRVERSQYIFLHNLPKNDVLDEAIAFYGEPQEVDMYKWYVRYGNAHARREHAEVYAEPFGVGLRIKGYWCKGSQDSDTCQFPAGTDNFSNTMTCMNRKTIGIVTCPSSAFDAVLEYELVDSAEMHAAWDAANKKRDEAPASETARASEASTQF